MAKKDYSALADAIIEKVGGKANISYLTHCVTRLRLAYNSRNKGGNDGGDGLQE